MRSLKLAKELLLKGDRAICLYTDGTHLKVNTANGTGASGWWDLSTTKNYTTIIFYMPKGRGRQTNEIHIAHHEGYGEQRDDGKREILFSHLSLVGTTLENWHYFAETGQNTRRILKFDHHFIS